MTALKRKRFRDPYTGKQFWETGTTRELDRIEARIETRRRELAQERRLNRHLRDGSTLEQAALEYAAQPTLSPASRANVASFRALIKETIGPRNFERLDARAVGEWIDGLRRTMKASSVAAHWYMLRAIASHAARHGLISRVPWAPYRPKLRADRVRVRECCRTVDELAELLGRARAFDVDQAIGRRLSALEPKLTVAACLGLRQSELARLSWGDVDGHAGTIAVTEAKRPADAPSRVLMLADPRVFEVLERYRAELVRAELFAITGPIFPAPSSAPNRPRFYPFRGKVIDVDDLRRVVRAAGLAHPERWTAHSMRDSFVTLEAYALGGDLGAIAARSRHHSKASMLRYWKRQTRGLAAPGFTLTESHPVPRLADGTQKKTG